MICLKLFLIIGYILHLFNSKNIKSIQFLNKLKMPCFIKQEQTYEITFNSLDSIPDFVHISISSLNNIQQIISFSSQNEQCLNGQKYRTNKSNFYLEKSQLSLNKNFICVECQYPFENCEFNISLLEGKSGLKLEEEKEKEKPMLKPVLSLKIYENNENDDDIILKISANTTIDIYTLDSTYQEKIQIPSSKKKFYQIDSKENGEYKIISGQSVTIRKDGMVYPKNQTWYWYGNVGTTSPPKEGQKPTRIQISFTLGKSIISTTVGSNTYYVTINVLDYASEYVEAKIDEYIKTNVTTKTTELDKLRAITAYPASFPYSGYYSGYMSMIIFEGGDCWASASTIHHICEKIGIKSHIRFAANDGGAGSGHRNVIAYIDKKYYICEAGYGINKPNRPYSVSEELLGYSTKGNKNGIVIYQYDGYDQEIIVPSSINNKTVIGVEKPVFANGPGKTATNITLPSTITFIGDSVFNSLPNIINVTIPKNVESIGLYVFAGSDNINEIIVDSENKALCTQNGILYTKNMTIIINYPPGKKGDKYEGLSTLERFENYSFYYTKQVKTIVVPERVRFIGEGAFARSNIKEIYFKGDPPILGEYVFADLNVSIYYPQTSGNKWRQYLNEKFKGKEIRWYTWEPTKINNNLVIIPCLMIGILIIAIIALYILRRRKNANNDNIDFNFNFKKLLSMN